MPPNMFDHTATNFARGNMEVVCSRNLRACILVIALSINVSGESYVQSSYVKKVESCKLAKVSQESTAKSEKICKFACLGLHESGNCAAYQWDTVTGACHMQDTLNVIDANATAADSVSVMLGTDSAITTCVEHNACPVGHMCVDPGCAGLSRSCVLVSDCADILSAKPDSPSGVYDITLRAGTQQQQVIQVWCDMDTDGGGWTVFLKRLDGSVDFYLDQAAYKQGFGDVNGEYWLGLDALHAITSLKTYKLRADISDWDGASVYSLHESMLVADETDSYRLTLGTFLGGNDGNCLDYYNNMKFSTKDNDQDARDSRHCAEYHYGGFWFNNCQYCNPTGKYYTGGVYTNNKHDGIQWRKWSVHNDDWYSMKTVEMKLRP